MDITELLQLAKTRGASDLHMVASRPPLFRIDGQLLPVENLPSLTPEDIEQALSQITTDQERADFDRCLELDFGRTIPDAGRVGASQV